MPNIVEVNEELLLKKVKVFKDSGVYIANVPSFSDPNKYYTVIFNVNEPRVSCDCKHFFYRQKPCKHIALFIKKIKMENL